MWYRIRSTMRSILKSNPTKDIEVNENQVEQQSSEGRRRSTRVTAHVTYQYPKNTAFRFPVIKDDVKSTRPVRQFEASGHQAEQLEHDIKRASDDDHASESTESVKTTKRFRPTQVPSPIYGYQRRETRKEQLETPAFMRQTTVQKTRVDEPIVTDQSDEASVINQEEIQVEAQEEQYDENEFESNLSVEPVETKVEAVEDEKHLTSETPHEEDELLVVESTEDLEQTTDTPNENIVDHKDSHEEIDASENIISFAEEIKREKEEHKPVEEDLTAHTPLNRSERRRLAREAEERALEEREAKSQEPEEGQEEPGIEAILPVNVIMTPKDKKRLMKSEETTEEQNDLIDEEIKPSVSQTDQFADYHIPAHLLNDPVPTTNEDNQWVEEQTALLDRTLMHFNVDAKVVKATQGPSVTRFEVQPEIGVKVSKVRNLSDDIKLNMAAKDIRIEAPIPGKGTIGIEVPNKSPQTVGLQEIFKTDDFQSSTSPLTIGLGLTVEGKPLVTTIGKMPHGLIAGATGSGKSVCINTILISLLYKSSPEEVKLLLIDPKMVELAPYNDIPHLVSPVITDVKAATAALKWAVEEMEARYEKFVAERVRDIDRYNEKMVQENRTEEKMPFMVIVIDELADLMMMAPQDVEESIARIAQKARACGMHLLIATQRPSVDVITGLIKANIPTRIAFSVSSQVDSRTIIDRNGADRLLGKGDMLFIENGSGESVRLQGPFVSDEEIDRVTAYVRKIAPPNYLFEQEELLLQLEHDEAEDELFHDVLEFILEEGSASTSLVQRNFRIGYNRAARIIDSLENHGIISEQNGSRPRDVLLSRAQINEII